MQLPGHCLFLHSSLSMVDASMCCFDIIIVSFVYITFIHCSAIAFAIPSNDLERFFCFRVLLTHCLRPVLKHVAISGGRFFNQRYVFFVYGSPNSHGCIAWEHFGNLNIAIGIGFSTATCSAFAARHFWKKSFATILYAYRTSSIHPCFTK